MRSFFLAMLGAHAAPCIAADAASDGLIDHIYVSMLDYDYLARPVLLMPRTLESMTAIGDGNATYTFRLRRGIHFTPDPAFSGASASRRWRPTAVTELA
jgi:ABC-type transport system substrate-binding protein